MSVSIFKASKQASSCHGVESKVSRKEKKKTSRGVLGLGFFCVLGFAFFFKLLEFVLF